MKYLKSCSLGVKQESLTHSVELTYYKVPHIIDPVLNGYKIDYNK
jgi:hypothetical protein